MLKRSLKLNVILAMVLCVAFSAAMCLGLTKNVCAYAAETIADEKETEYFGRATVTLKIENAFQYENALKQPVDNVLVKVNSNLDVIGEDNLKITSLAEMILAFSGKTLFTLELCDAETADALSAFSIQNNFVDYAITCLNFSELNTYSAKLPNARVYYQAEEGSLSNRSEQADVIMKANLVGAQTIIVKLEDLSYDSVRYIQSRFKCVWAITNGTEKEVCTAVTYGVYGIIANSLNGVNNCFSAINGESYKDENNRYKRPLILGRMPYNVAHRGDTTSAPENTKKAVTDAYKTGATHVELDIRMTKDEQIVLLHDDDLKYAMKDLSGNQAVGKISTSTLKELRENFTMSDGTTKISTIDDIFETVSSCKDLIYLIEFKGQEARLVELFAQKVAQYDVAKQIAVISFYENQLKLVAEQLPSIPTSLLLYTTEGSRTLVSASTTNSGVDMQFNGNGGMMSVFGGDSVGESYDMAFRYYANRGYSLWLWTYETDNLDEAVRYGVTGITTNDNSYLCNKPLKFDGIQKIKKGTTNKDVVKASAITYCGEKITVNATVKIVGDTIMLVYEPEKGYGGFVGVAEISQKTGCSNCSLSCLMTFVFISLNSILMLKRKFK